MRTAYPSTAVSATHPARLAAFAALHGLRGGFSPRFRYVELGCGDASNLLPLAARFPEARFVGVDHDRTLIDRADTLRRTAGLDNVELLAADLREVTLEGRFDYVVTHGVYSWVPPEVQQRVLALCGSALASDGVAYVSYNALPGWRLRAVVRDVMRAAARGAASEQAALRAAKSALSRVQRHLTAPQHPYTALLSAELGLAQSHPDGYLLGEHLADHNEALYVGELARRAEAHGLRYLDEALPATPDGEVELSVISELTASGLPRVEAEQVLDVVTYRQFRATLLCRAEAPVDDTADRARLPEDACFAGKLIPTSEEPLLGPGKALGFRTPTGAVIEAEQPLLKAALLSLAEAWPEGAAAPRLIGAALGALRRRALLERCAIDEAEIDRAVESLTALAERRLIELLPWTPRPTRAPGERPEVPLWTRLEAERSATVTSPRHEPLPLDATTRVVAQLLDGTRGLDELTQELRAWIDSGELKPPVEDPADLDQPGALAELARAAVRRVAALGLLAEPAGGAPPAALPDAPPPPRNA